MSKPQEKEPSPAVKWAITLIFGYLVVGLSIHFVIYTPNANYNRTIENCGGATPFCACQAKAIVEQRSFISDPLLLLGVKEFRKVSAECSHLK